MRQRINRLISYFLLLLNISLCVVFSTFYFVFQINDVGFFIVLLFAVDVFLIAGLIISRRGVPKSRTLESFLESLDEEKTVVDGLKIDDFTWAIIKTWEPPRWKDYTGSVHKTKVALWSLYDFRHKIWLYNVIDSLTWVNSSTKIYEIKAEWHGKTVELSNKLPLAKLLLLFDGDVEVVLISDGKVEGINIRFYYYKDAWYFTELSLNEDEIQILIEDTETRKLEKVRRHINRAKSVGKSIRRGRVPEDVQIFVWNRDGGNCVVCGNQEKLEFDHIIPVSKGGNNTARNIQLLCESCNRSKGSNIGV